MTEDFIAKIANDETAFRMYVVRQLGVIETRAKNDCDDLEAAKADVAGVKRTIYGPDGDKGLVGEVARLKQTTATWSRWLILIQALMAGAIGWLEIFRGK
jgi:hypothetical protein